MVLTNTQKSNKKLSLRRDERGLTTVEYVILLVLMAVAGIGVWNTLGKTVRDKINDSNGKVDGMKTTPDDSTAPADQNGG